MFKMEIKMRQLVLIAFLFLLRGIAAHAQTLAFPTAEGYGKWASGGRGGKVVEVTTVEDDGTANLVGSLRWALRQYSGSPLTVVFRVSGIIDLKGVELRSNRSNVTIAGQTAPGDGICIKGESVNFGGSFNVIVRHIRFRTGAFTPDGKEVNAASVILENGGNFIFDHCSFSWSAEELCDLTDGPNWTAQWCIFSEGLYQSVNGKGARSYGPVIIGDGATFHHNLMAHNVARAPRFGVTTSVIPNVLFDYVNNVNYNFGKSNACYGGENEMGKKGLERINFMNNYYKQGPAYPGSRSAIFVRATYEVGLQDTFYTKWHLSGNYIDGSANQNLNADNYLGLDIGEYQSNVPGCTLNNLKSDRHVTKYPVNMESAQDAFNSVMAKAGAYPLDTVDRRVIYETVTGTASKHGSFNNYAVSGIIDSPEDAGGWPEYKTYNTITDNDHDGMDDAWETANGLDPANANDGNIYVQSGHTVLEVYLNSLCGETIPLKYTISETKIHDFMVAQDGTGDFTSINEAINAVPEDGLRHTIFIKKGTYKEKVFIGNRWQTSSKIISMIGENVDSVIIEWSDFHGKTITYPGKDGTISADGMTAATMTVTSPDFYMENITVKNPSTDAQAEALYQSGDKQVLKNCKILGNQDTHRTKKGNRFFYFRCTIEGGVDFIYSGGTCYFYQCDIVSNRGGYLTAPEDITYKATLSNGQTLRYGFFFKDCDILATSGVSSNDVYLGRPWGPECGSVFLNCRLGDHINPKGWSTMGADNEKSACFAEYKSMNANGTALADISQRIDWSMQLTTTDVNNLMLLSSIYSKVSSKKFDPVAMVIAPAAPKSVGVKDVNRVVWTANNDALGYAVYANGSLIGFSKINNYTDTLVYATSPTYNVKEIGEIGNLSLFKGETLDYTYESIIKAIDTSLSTVGIGTVYYQKTPRIENGVIYFDQPTRLRIYNLSGQQYYSEENCLSFNIDQLTKGIFLFKATDSAKNNFSFKIIH